MQVDGLMSSEDINKRIGKAYDIFMENEVISDQYQYYCENDPNNDTEILNEILMDALIEYIQTLKKVDVINKRLRLLNASKNTSEKNELLSKMNFIESDILNINLDRIKKIN